MTNDDLLLLKIPEAAERLSLSRSTIYEMISAGQLPVIHVGRAVRIPAAELAAWVSLQVAEQR